MTPSVSILMPVYNTAQYLREAVDSILNQTFTDFELIVLNDCSPDNADEILDTYTDTRIIRYKGEKNQGLANVLNIGTDMARGKYIARMDSDDISLPNRLQVQVDYLESHPDIDLCSCGMQLFGAKKEIWTRTTDPEKVKLEALFFSPILHASSVWRKDSFDRYGLRFRQERVPSEDFDMWCRALAFNLRLVNVKDILYKYRIREGQASTNTEKTYEKDLLIRADYFRKIFPHSSDKLIDNYLHWDSCNINRLRITLLLMVSKNIRYHFFDTKMLCARLYKFYKKRET